MAKRKPQTMVERLKSVEPTRRKTWIDNVSSETRATLEDIRSEYRAGGFPAHVSASYLHRECRAELGITVSVHTFQRWMMHDDR